MGNLGKKFQNIKIKNVSIFGCKLSLHADIPTHRDSSFNLKEYVVLLAKLPPYVQSNRHQRAEQMFFDHRSFVTSTCACCGRLSRLQHCLAFPSLLFGDSYLLGLLQLQVKTRRQHFTCLPFFHVPLRPFCPFPLTNTALAEYILSARLSAHPPSV